MAIIKLRNSSKTVLVDDDMYDKLNEYKWRLDAKGNYPTRSQFTPKGPYTVSMHRDILGLSQGDGKYSDHINGNGLDNRVVNLRICTHKQNMRNRQKNRNNTSGYKGVYWHKNNNRWTSFIRKNNKLIYIGYFATALEAAKAYNKAAIEHHGEFARLNKI